MRTQRFALVILLAAGWLSSRAICAEGPVWPPPGAEAPAEVAWQAIVEEFRPKGLGRFFRAVAGAERHQQAWTLPRPVAVALAKDRVFVVDTAMSWVIGGKTDGSSAVKLKLPDGVQPVAIASTPDGNQILVADRELGVVFAFDLKGSLLGEVVGRDLVQRCGGIAACANGDVLITDAEAGQVVRVSTDGLEVARSGGRGTGDGEFNTPTAVAEAPDGTVWVLDPFNFRVQQLDAELQYLSQFGQHGDGSGHFALAKGLAIDPDGHIYVSDARFDAVQVFDGEGQLLLIIGGRGFGAGEFWTPGGLAIDRRGHLVVADTGNRRIQLMRYQRRDNQK
jgi:DNA-binding beta-propeller fold protein YncE